VSPNQVFPSPTGPLSEIAERVHKHPDLIYDVSANSIVIATKHELLVRQSVPHATSRLDEALSGIARNFGWA
jgi:hypothetical protein